MGATSLFMNFDVVDPSNLQYLLYVSTSKPYVNIHMAVVYFYSVNNSNLPMYWALEQIIDQA